MQQSQNLRDPSPCSSVLRRRRQQRTVYSKEQQQELEREFAGCKYPAYEERKALADRLSLNQHQVQVWFKNRRAKHSRQMRQQQPQQRLPRPRGQQLGAPDGPGSWPGAPTPAPAAPEFPGGPGFCSHPPPTPMGVFAAADPVVSSQGSAWGAPAQGAPSAPAPAWAQHPHASGLSPDPALVPGVTGVLTPQDPFGSTPVFPTTSGYQAAPGFVDGDSSCTKTLLNL